MNRYHFNHFPRLAALAAVWDDLPGNVHAHIFRLAHDAVQRIRK